jgi:hypothetical protein
MTTFQAREEAVAKIKRSLEEFYAEGLKTIFHYR